MTRLINAPDGSAMNRRLWRVVHTLKIIAVALIALLVVGAIGEADRQIQAEEWGIHE